MKSTIFLIIAFSCLAAIGQINLEKTYDEGMVNRVDLEFSGEKYYLLDQSTNQVKLYNADHTAWKTIPLPTLAGPLDVTISHLSENKINADNNIEIAYSYYTEDGEIVFNSRIVSEEGTVLLNVSDASSIEVSEIPGLPVKIIALIDDENSSTKVFSVPDFTLENTYSSENIIYDGYITRVNLENSGEKYYQLDELNNQVKLYNVNHTTWKTIDLFPMEGTIYLKIDHVSENIINADAKIEVAYTYYDESFYIEGKISNEDGTVLFTLPNAYLIEVDKISGLSNKLIVVFYDLTYLFSSKVYTLPSLAVEGAYGDGEVVRVKLENAGEKYYIGDVLTNQAKLYNADHTLWKTINLPVTSGASLVGITHLSEAVINIDSPVEIAYVTSDNEARIIDDTGSSLLIVENALGIYTSQMAGLPNKLIVTMDGFPETSKVYGLPTTTLGLQKENPVEAAFTIYPNPTNHILTIESKNTTLKNFMITSVLGKIVKEVKQTSQSLTIDVSDLNPGTYFMKGQTMNGVIFNYKIIIY